MYNNSMNSKFNFLYETPDGIIFCVKLVPNSSHNKVVDFTDEYVRIKICSPPIENKANKELVEFCSDFLNINKSKIKLVSGDKSKLKKLLILDSEIDYVTKNLMFVLDSLHKQK